jgi:hypothetical protein
MERIHHIYLSLARFQEIQECQVLYPTVVTSTSDPLDQIGITDTLPGFTKSPPLPCYQSTKRRIRVDSDSGAAFVVTFWLLIDFADGVQDITDRCTIFFNTKTHAILEFDHDVNKRYWKVRLKDED